MESLKEKCLELMEQKYTSLKRMVDITKQAEFTGLEANAEKEVEAFVSLYERRTNILESIEKIDDAIGQLDPLEASDMEDEDFQARVVSYRERMKEIAVEMLALDRANTVVHEKLNVYLKDNMRRVRQSKDLSSRYSDEFEMPGGSLLDKKH